METTGLSDTEMLRLPIERMYNRLYSRGAMCRMLGASCVAFQALKVIRLAFHPARSVLTVFRTPEEAERLHEAKRVCRRAAGLSFGGSCQWDRLPS